MVFKAILFDFIGTTVQEKVPDTITRGFHSVFQQFDIRVPSNFIESNRGKNKREVLSLAAKESPSPNLVDNMLNAFNMVIEQNLSNFSSAENAELVFEELWNREIKIALGTGLTRDSFDVILHHLKWDLKLLDYMATSEEIGRGRPHPDMILDMMKELNISNPKQVLKVGDTISDIEEGKNAGVFTVAILSGTQSKKKLIGAKPDFLINDLKDVLKII